MVAQRSLLGFVVTWWKLAGRAQLRTSLVDQEACSTVIAGSVEIGWRPPGGALVEPHPGGEAMTTMEQVVTQLQQELLTHRAQIAAGS